MNAIRFLVAALMAASFAAPAYAQRFGRLRESVGLQDPPAPAAPEKVPAAPTPASPTQLLTEPPSTNPPGTYSLPGYEHGCNGPVGRNGPLTYEVYAITGVSMPVGGGELSSALLAGWTTGGGTRTLWFRPDSTAAWYLDLGLSYTENSGRDTRTLSVATPQVSPIQTNPLTGATTGGDRVFPDLPNDYFVRKLARTNFNFAVGRDWWLDGPGSLPAEQAPNWRTGVDVGGRWGTSHIDLVPVTNPDNTYLKRTGVTHSVFIGTHLDWEKPVGAWIFFAGVRAEWGYTITNLVPPLGGDIHDVNILLVFGARF